MASKWTIWLSVSAVLLASVGCAEEREPVNKVQANALEKSFFVGALLQDTADDPEFHTGATVVDVPYGADQAGVFPGLIGGLRRVKWEILEDVLNARLTYEEIEGSDGHGNRRTNNGRVIGSWAVESHFDIKRAYNPQTGEELNVIEENSSDRPWYERKYFRVDWSQNLVASSMLWDPIAQAGATGSSLDTESLQYYVDDPSNPDAPLFDGETGYFDVTNKLYLKPKQVTVSGQTLNACMYRGSIVIGATAPWGNCENSEVTVRYSFSRIAQPGEPGYTDYEPVEWDGSRMNSFGAFITDRMGWDDRYGIIDNEWRRMANRYNIWQRSHTEVACNSPESRLAKLDPRADADKNGTHDQCEASGPGSRCDALMGLCTIPYAQRELRTVAWHMTVGPEGDTLIFDWTRRATQEWDVALRVAVQTARLVECRRTQGASLNGTRWQGQTCEEAFPVVPGDDAELKSVHQNLAYPAQIEVSVPPTKSGEAPTVTVPVRAENTVKALLPLVVLCHNPVVEGDDPSCGAPETKIRPGDIRYHHVNAWPTRQNGSPWGYGPTLADPLTGEVISAGINVYNAVTDSAAQAFVDQLRWMNGEIKSSDISSGNYIKDWQAEASEKRPAFSVGGPRLTKAEADKRALSMAGLDKLDPKLEGKLPVDARKLVEQMKEDLWWNRLPPDGLAANRAEFDQRIEATKGSKVEAALTNSMWAQMSGVDPASPMEGDTLEVSSPLRGMRSHVIREAGHQIELLLAQRGQCMVGAPEPTGLPALAQAMKNKFPLPEGAPESPDQTKQRVDRMFDYLRGRMHYSVILHEMGHTVTLRHNFTSSYDKFNYRPQYWQLRTNNGDVQTLCEGNPSEDPATCVGPRFFDPLTQPEIDGSIWTWQHTTVMDYPGDLTQDMMGLGVYDYAAARMFYADVVDLAHDPEFVATVPDPADPNKALVVGTDVGNEIVGLVDYSGGLLGQIVMRPGSPGQTTGDIMHYSEWNNHFKFIRSCDAPDPAKGEYATPPPGWDEAVDGRYDPVFDGHIVNGTVCERFRTDFAAYEDLIPDTRAEDLNTDPRFFSSRRARDSMGRPRMPYAFESDEYADGWSPSTYRHDNGADLYEELTFHTNLYENRHIFDNFRNGRVNFTVYGAYQRALSRYHAKVSSLTQGIAYLAGWYFREYAKSLGYSHTALLAGYFGPGSGLYDIGVGASLGFDHFARVLTRPHVGPHFIDAKTKRLMPSEDMIGSPGATLLNIPNGSYRGEQGEISFGGRPLNNDFQFGHGYFGFDYLNQAGSYYEKTYAFEAMLEASWRAFNFWRFDGLDGRFHHVNYSDLYRDGMRRLIGVMLTGDADLYAPRVTADLGQPFLVEGAPDVYYPRDTLGWVSYVSQASPELCFSANGVLTCNDPTGGTVQNGTPPDSLPIDPQLGFEVQKFIAYWTYIYQPGQQEMDWVDMMRIYKIGAETDPDYLPVQRVGWRDPESGLRYVARKYGEETILGKVYDKGIAAKMIQWANLLTSKVYVLDPTEPFDPVTGQANVLLDANGQPTLQSSGTCEDSVQCTDLRLYRGLLDFMRDTAAQVGFPEPALQVFGGD